MSAVIIPYNRLDPETLQSLVEDFVTRDGTDYGEVEVSLKTRVEQIMDQLRTGKAVVVFDPVTETANIMDASAYKTEQ